MLAPVGRRSRVRLHSRLIAVRIIHQGEETIDLGEILLLRLHDRLLGQIVAEYILWIDAIHPLPPVGVGHGLFTQTSTIPSSPAVERAAIHKIATQVFIQISR